MADELENALPPEFSKSEIQSPKWQFQFLDPTTIEAGEIIAPAKLSGRLAREFSDWHMISADFSFALECFTEANNLGNPNPENLHSKALIYSAVIAYARPFKTSVRTLRLDIGHFSNLPSFSQEAHNYLIAIRDKHVAHSVNDFERSDATGVMVGTPETNWRPAGVGVTIFHAIGLSKKIVEEAISQISDMKALVDGHIERLRPELFKHFCAEYVRDKRWEMAPIAQFPDRKKVQSRRN